MGIVIGQIVSSGNHLAKIRRMQLLQNHFLSDFDPLQAGYQAIIDICEEARSRNQEREFQARIREPERASILDQRVGTDAHIRQHPSPGIMLPPQRFQRRPKNSFALLDENTSNN